MWDILTRKDRKILIMDDTNDAVNKNVMHIIESYLPNNSFVAMNISEGLVYSSISEFTFNCGNKSQSKIMDELDKQFPGLCIDITGVA